MFGRRRSAVPAPASLAPEPFLYDPETGLPGAALMTDRLQMALRGAERNGHEVGLVIVEVVAIESPDGPVSENDTRAALYGVGDRLDAVVRGVDSVGRLGPTTFALVLQGEVGADGLRTLARRVLFELSPPVLVGVRPLFVLATLGGTIALPGRDDPAAMRRRAEAALSEAREDELFVLQPAEG